MNQNDLISGIRDGRQQLETIWAGLDDAQMTRRPGPQSDWSVKDLIAHLTHWEQFTIDALENSLSGGEPTPDPDTDAVNAQVLAANYDRPLADVRADFERSRLAFEALVTKLTNAEINALPRFKWEYEETVGELLASESYLHYQSHIPDLTRYINQF